MSHLIKAILFGLCTVTPCLTPSCSGQRIAGGTSIPNQIAGVVYSPQGKPLANVHVALVSDLDVNSPYPVDSATTNDSGKYIFTNVPSGTYSVTAVINDSSFVASHSGISVDVEIPLTTVSDTLHIGGRLSGNVAIPPGPAAFLQIQQTPFRTSILSNGSFSFGLVPQGTHIVTTLAAPAGPKSLVVIHVDTALVNANGALTLDTIHVVPMFSGTGDFLLDNFEDSNVINSLGSWWWTFNNSNDGGNSTVAPGPGDTVQKMLFSPGAAGTSTCAHISYVMGTHGINYAGMGCNLEPYYNGMVQTRDVRNAKRVNFWLRGTGGGLYLAISSHAVASGGNTILTLAATPINWTYYSINLDSAFADAASTSQWNATRPFIDQIVFVCTGDTPVQGEIWIDEVSFSY
jgi:hypothetical protein